MRIKPTTYAQLLISSLEDKPDFEDLARRLWYMLQKNKQYRDLPKILDELEKVYAEKEGFTIAHVESGEELNSEELDQISQKLSDISNKPIFIKSKINPSVTGIIAKVDGKVIDLSVEDKIQGLRKALARNG